MQLDVARDIACLHRRRRLVAQDLLDGVWNEAAVGSEDPSLVGESVEQIGGPADQAGRRLVAGRRQQSNVAQQLIVAQRKVKPSKDQPDAAPAVEEKHLQFARSPFLVAFQSGWFRFSLCTVHIYYGKDSGAQLQQRIAEIEGLVKFFADRQDSATKQEKDSSGAPENYVLLGDFNVVSPEHKTMAALKSHGFTVPAAIDGKQVRKEGDHFYDQIAVRVKDPRFRVVQGGMIDVYQDVFRDTDEDRALYAAHVPKTDPEKDAKFKAKTPEALYRKWRTWQMSDHLPMWLQLKVDFTDQYLGSLKPGEVPLADLTERAREPRDG